MMSSHEDSLSIGAFAQTAGIGVETVRFYQRRELLPEPHRVQGRIRRYGSLHLARVRFIKCAQRLGFSLEEIAKLLQLDEQRDCAQARVLATSKLAEVRAELEVLHHLETALSSMVQACDATVDTGPCALISAMHKCGCPGAC